MKKEIGLPSIEKPWLKWYSKEALEASIPYMKTCDYLKINNLSNLDTTAINYFERKISYGEMQKNIDKAARAFQEMGVKEGDIVTFCVPSLPEVIYAFYGLNKIGAVAALIDPTTNNERIADFIDVFDSKYLVMVDIAYPKLNKILKNSKLEKVITVSPADSLSNVMKFGYKLKNMISNIKKETKKLNIPFGDFYINYKQFLNYDKGNLIESEYKKDKPAAIVLTSGTTGVPKGAVLSNENLNAIAVEALHCTGMKRFETFLNIMPPFIAYGLVCGISNVLCNGLEMIIVPKLEKRGKNDVIKPGEPELDESNMFDSLIVKKQPNNVLGVPDFYIKLSESEKVEDLSFLTGCVAGGDTFHPSKEQLVNSFLKAHQCEAKICKGYGMTELGSVASYTINNETNKLGSVGVPFMFNNIKILDPNTGKELGYNQTGELYVSGPGLILGYFGNTEETKKNFITDSNGVRWVKTGDLFSIDEDGVLYFKGRIKRMMVRADGHNVFNEPIENVILTHPAVEDCAVVGVKDIEIGETPTAIVVLKDEYKGYEEEIEKQLRTLSLQKLPERDVALKYSFWNKIPLTLFGKVDYRQLEQIEQEKVLKLTMNG